ncbi:hypothetical protein LCGC14_3161540 [marine sediment metagenome]|uniref:Uncharacterized protein n=1 Tax=marine sediment metagenome TaxID=412755 RepID=A0A0F8XXT6_9ZZZZ
MGEYQGHRSWNAWNVALWIDNDEPLYRFAMDCLQAPTARGSKPTLALATSRFMCNIWATKTPDGATYNRTCVREALAGYKEDN